MPPERDPVPRARSAVHWLSGILLLGVLAGGVVAAGVALWQNLDVRQLVRTPASGDPRPLPEALPTPSPAHENVPLRVAVFYSDQSAAFFPDPEYYSTLIGRWEELAAALGADPMRVRAEDLDALEPDVALLAPAALCLEESEVRALRRHLERGGGLVLTWATGARDGACEWIGWRRISELTGAADVRELETRDALYFTVPAGLPLSPGVSPATRIELRSESQLALSGSGTGVFWSDWALNPLPAAGTSDVEAALWAGWTEDGGRLAWFGFLTGQGARPRDEEPIERLHMNAILWAAGLPYAEIAPWPGDARAAVVFSQDVESEFQNSARLAAIAAERGVPVSFYVVTRLALEHPELADSLARVGEVASQTSDHGVVAGLPAEEQRARLQRSWAEIRGWTGDSAVGLRPPEERFDENTLSAWRAIGGSYVAAVNNARTGSPEIFETESGPIVLLPRIIKDDYNVLVQESTFGSKRLLEAYLEGVRKVRGLGGLAFLSTHSQVAGTPRRVRVLGEVMDTVAARDGDWWAATGRAVAEWWLVRSQTAVAARRDSADALEFVVESPEDRPLEGAWLRIILPGNEDDLQPVLDGLPVPFAREPWGISVALGDLHAGQRARLTLVKPGGASDSESDGVTGAEAP
jgi:peptidoglycan/xylan/chitin deacetylase (PgdA/CDA1 family)